MRVIPKKTNVRLELFPGLEVIDVVVGGIGAALTVMLLMANIPGHYVAALIVAAVTAALIVPIDDDKGYLMLIYFLRYLGRPKQVVKRSALEESGKGEGTLAIEDFTPFTGIDGNYIEFGGEYSATVVNVPSVEFRFYTENRQNNMIDRVFAGILRTAAEDETILLMKLDQPLVYDDCIENEQSKLTDLEEAYMNGLLNNDELTVRVGIVQDRIEHLRRINFKDRIFQPFHYVVFVHKDRTLIQSQASNCVSQFRQNNIEARQLKGKEL